MKSEDAPHRANLANDGSAEACVFHPPSTSMFGPADDYVTVETRITHIMLKIDILIGCNEERGSFPLPAMSGQLVNDFFKLI